MRRPAAWAAAGLAVFLAWQAGALGFFILRDSRPPAWDEANHLTVARAYFDAAGKGRWGDIWGYTPNGSMPPFPPLYHLGAALAYLSRDPAGAALWLNWLYFSILTVSLFAITRRLRPEAPSVAAAAGVAFGCAPLVQGLMRAQLVDLPLTAMVALAYWALLRSEGFSDRRASFWFGAAFAAGLLYKWSFFSYLLPAGYLGFRAFWDKKRRANALWALGIAVGLGFPWYAVRLPLVLVRLTQATADFVIPVWKGAAFFHYAYYLPRELGWGFCAAALYGAWALRRDKRPAVRVAFGWFLASYLFWAMIPNRQTRYLLPGLPPLAALASAACPAPLLWGLAAWQAAASVVRPPVSPLSEDWKIDEILRDIAAPRPGEPSLTAVSLIANDRRFNKLNFIWRAGELGLSDLQLRGVNDVPWELSPFVVLKEGWLGPRNVTVEFNEAEAAIRGAGGWFARAFAERRRWLLPDGSFAVLYERKRLKAPPFEKGRLELPLYFSAKLAMPKAAVVLGGWDWRRGIYKRIRISAPEAGLRGLKVSGVSLELSDALLVPDRDGARLVRVGAVKVLSAAVEEASLRAYLDRSFLRMRRLDMDGTLRAAAILFGLPVSAELSAQREGASLCRVEVDRARLGALPIPAGLLKRYGTNGPIFSIEKAGDRTVFRTLFGLWRAVPFPVELAGCSIAGGRMSIP